MSIKPILVWPNPKLHQLSQPVVDTDSEDTIRNLVDDLFDTLHKAGGAGLSAIQIGVPLRVFVMDCKTGGKAHAFVNPEIVETVDDPIEVEEGCLSIPGVFDQVLRFPQVQIRAVDWSTGPESKLFDLYGLEAQCAQHEIEHFEGMLFVQKFGRVKQDILKRKMQKHLRLTKR